MKSKVNEDNDNLYCLSCKERIEVGEKYLEDVEDYFGEYVIKCYHLDSQCVPEDEESDPYIAGE